MWLSRMVYSVGSLEHQGPQLDNFAYPIRTNKKESTFKKKKCEGPSRVTIQVLLRAFWCTFGSLLSRRDVVWIRFLNDIIWIQVGFNCHLFSDLFFYFTISKRAALRLISRPQLHVAQWTGLDSAVVQCLPMSKHLFYFHKERNTTVLW